MRIEIFFQPYQSYRPQREFFVKKGAIIVAGFYDDDGRIPESRNMYLPGDSREAPVFCNDNALLILLEDATFDAEVCCEYKETMVQVFSLEKSMILCLPVHSTYVKVVSRAK